MTFNSVQYSRNATLHFVLLITILYFGSGMPMNPFVDQESMASTGGSENRGRFREERPDRGLTALSPSKCFLMPAGRCSLQMLNENNGLKI